MSFRDDIKGHADKFWSQPCQDGSVWTSYRAIHINAELGTRKLPSSEWTGAFLNYDSGKGRSEGLFVIKKSERAKALATWNVESCPSAVMLATFHDKRSDDPAFPAGKPPKDFALNDCTHFTSECVVSGGQPSSLASISAGEFFDKLHASTKTKTLARVIPLADARQMIEAPRSPFKVGDVIVYSGGENDHHHALVHLGAGQIAMHTIAIHKDHPTLGSSARWDRLSGDAHHNHVTLYHFNDDDSIASSSSFLPGWWKVTFGVTTWHYFFETKNGRVSYQNPPPHNTKAAPTSPEGKGYWFEDGNMITICWTTGGTFERFTFKPGGANAGMSGTTDGKSGLTATKL